MSLPSRTIAAWSAAAGAGVIALAGFAGRDRLVEEWHLWRLEAADPAARFHAAKRLGELCSTRAIPGLIDLLETISPGARAAETDCWGPGTSPGDGLAGVLGAIGRPAVAPLARALEESRGERRPWRRYACRALGRTGSEAAVPPLAAALDDPDTCVRVTAFQVLGSMGSIAREAVPAIAGHLEDRSAIIRRAAADALEGIGAAPDVPSAD